MTGKDEWGQGVPWDNDGMIHRSDGPCIAACAPAAPAAAPSDQLVDFRARLLARGIDPSTFASQLVIHDETVDEVSAAAVAGLQAELDAERERGAAWRLAAERAHAYDITVTVSAATVLEQCSSIDDALRYLAGIAAIFGPARIVGPADGPSDLAVAAWRAVAVSFAADAADEGTYLPTDPTILAYNLARNGRYAEAMEMLGEQVPHG